MQCTLHSSWCVYDFRNSDTKIRNKILRKKNENGRTVKNMSAFTGWVNHMCHGNFPCNAWIILSSCMVYHLNYIDIHFGEMFIKRFIWYSGMNKILSVPRATNSLSPFLILFARTFAIYIVIMLCSVVGHFEFVHLRCEWREFKKNE